MNHPHRHLLQLAHEARELERLARVLGDALPAAAPLLDEALQLLLTHIARLQAAEVAKTPDQKLRDLLS